MLEKQTSNIPTHDVEQDGVTVLAYIDALNLAMAASDVLATEVLTYCRKTTAQTHAQLTQKIGTSIKLIMKTTLEF